MKSKLLSLDLVEGTLVDVKGRNNRRVISKLELLKL